MMEKKHHTSKLETAYLKTCYELFDIDEAKRSNILISGGNNTGKTNLACQVASLLQRFGWRVVAFDSSGAWREQSDIPQFVTVNFDYHIELFKVPTFYTSVLYDLTLLLPVEQKAFVDLILLDLWHQQLEAQTNEWIMIFLEEAQLYTKNIRSHVAQNILRIMTVGRNQKLRVTAITPDLALIDASIIRLTGQRWHGKLNIEANSKRRFNAYYGKDWSEVTLHHDVGMFTYLLRDKLKVVSVPYFKTQRKPINYDSIHKPSMIKRLLRWIYHS